MSVNHLLYSKFDAMGVQMSPLLAELERRSISYPSELKSLLEECQMAYLAVRKSLLTPRLATEIKGLDPANSELIELVRRKEPWQNPRLT
jgi:conserved oligomeric Golgi complex subunit 3